MKKLSLCYECGVTGECETYCRDAIEFERQDRPSNYRKEDYTRKGIALYWNKQKARINEEFERWN